MDVSRQFPALADPTRRAVFESLVQRPQSVGELADQLPVSRPAVSQHLKVLQDAELVQFVRTGTRNIYEVDHQGLAALHTYIEALWTEALGSLKAVADATYRSRKRDKEHR
jgi:DNA-binding transcriptional ArsR family regulator